MIFSWDAVPPPIQVSFIIVSLNLVSMVIQINKQNMSDSRAPAISLAVYTLFVLNNFLISFVQEKARRGNYATKNRIKFEENTVDHVLANLLPPFVRARFSSCKLTSNPSLIISHLYLFQIFFLAGNVSIEEDQGDVAILFLDICDFDDILNEKLTAPIKWIDDLYRLFDKVCVEYGV